MQITRHMEIHSDCGKDPSDEKQKKKLGSILNFEKHFEDIHPQVVKNSDNLLPKSKWFHQKQRVERKFHDSEELVKYMSNLPSFLERGENKKAFNLGVLDWRLLEKWQHGYKDLTQLNLMHLPSSSNTSSSFPCNVAKDDIFQSKMGISESRKGKGSLTVSREEKSSGSLARKVAENDFSKVKTVISESGNGKGSIKVNQEEKNVAKNDFSKVKTGVSESTKVRNPSPNRRFSFGLDRIGKSSSSENLHSGDTTCEKSNATSRSRSSPLRRLLDPLLKPKGSGDSNQFTKSIGKSPSRIDRTSNSVKVKGPQQSEKNGSSSTKQALLQVTLKNGLPLYTFTVDNNSDILAATVKDLTSSKKVVPRWVYTFYSFSETKKRSVNWINQGCKDSNHAYIPNVIAQMKVSDIPCTIKSNKREFVLSSMSTKDVDHISDSLPNDELAAIIVKFPENIIGQVHKDCHQNDDVFSLTVILPGGDHGVPRKGDPSPLIERWKSGGSCDCGGWDLGCRLRILDNSNQSNQISNSTKFQSTTFKLFSQEEMEENKLIFNLSPFEDGIFSVEFDSSLKLIQAFSIGIAILNSSSNTWAIFSEEIRLSKNNVTKISNRGRVEVPTKYVSYPPLSPVGRV